MKEVKINVSDEMNEIIQSVSEGLGIKKTEFVKSLVIENLKEIKIKDERK